MENGDFLKSMLFPKKNHTFSCPRAPKSHQNRAQTPSQTNFDDILRPKSFEETPWSDHMAVRTRPGTPKERPRGPQGPPRDAKAIFAPPRELRSQPTCKACRHCQRQLLHVLRHAKEGFDTPGALMRAADSKCCAHTAAREVGANHARPPALENC